MSDSYQPIYEAVRSRIRSADTGSILETAAREAFDISLQKCDLSHAINTTAYELQRPSTVYRPSLSIEGNQWMAFYGANPRDGVAGFGDSPVLAMADFDKTWTQKLTPASQEGSVTT